jgi:branched-chain amino acid transport system permease protein
VDRGHVPQRAALLGVAGVPLALVLAAVTGVLLGIPVLKLRGDYLAIVTLGFGEIIRIFMNNLDHPVNITNGPKGINQIDPVHFFGIDLAKPLQLGGFDMASVSCTTTCSWCW